MALVVIRCPCGCVFRRDETSEKVCPSCNTLHGHGTGLAEGLSPATLRSLLVLAVSLLAGLLLVLVALLLRRPPAAPPPTAVAVPTPAPAPAMQPPARVPAVPKAVAAPPPRGMPELDELQGPEIARAYRLVARANLGNLAKAVLLHADAGEAALRLRAVLQAEHEELADLVARHPRRSELRALPQHIEPNDRILGFATVAHDPRRPGPFVDEVKAWFRTLQPGAVTLVTVQRGDATLILPIYAPTFAEDIASLIRLTGVSPGAGGSGDARVRRPLPAALLAEVQRRLEQLHPIHRDALPPEIDTRIAELLRFGSGSEEDEIFLRVRVLDMAIRPLEEDYARLRRRSADLDVQSFASILPDVLVYKSGRRLAVRILGETDERIHVRIRSGEARFQKADLTDVERGQAAVAEIETAYAKARNDIPALLSLLPRLRDPRFKLLRDMVCARLLVLDPLHDAAWAELGFAPRLLAPPARDQDLIVLKDGSRRSGRILEEGPGAILLEVPVRGSRGEVLGAGRVRLDPSDVERIDRMTEPARADAQARASAREEDRRRVEADLARLRTSTTDFHGFRGLAVDGTHFELSSTAPERETRETAHALEAVFTAFQREFDARRNAGRRIKIHFLADRAQFDAYQKALRGTAIPIPAYFSVKDNCIAAYDPVQTAEARAVREEIRRADQAIERQLKSLAEEEARLEEQVKVLQQSLAEQAAARRRTDEAPEAVDAWKERQAGRIRRTEAGLREQFSRYRREARRAVEGHQAAAIRLQASLAAQAAALRATLIHEAFHAFAANFLWAELDNERLPRWLHEGFASYFETAVIDAGEVRHGAPQTRHLALLRAQARAGTLPPVDGVLRARAGAFAADHRSAAPELSYAQAWLIAHWMASRGLDRDSLDRYAQATAGGADPAEALEAVTGLAGPELDAAVRLHLDRLPEGSR